MLAFADYTGWTQVALLEQVVRLESGTTKNHEPRMIPLAPDLYEVLKMQRSIRGQKYPTCPWVFFREGEQMACNARPFHDLRRTQGCVTWFVLVCQKVWLCEFPGIRPDRSSSGTTS